MSPDNAYAELICDPGCADMVEMLVPFIAVGYRYFIASEPGTPLGVLTVLARDVDIGVRQRVAVNPNTPKGVLIQMYRDTDDSDDKDYIIHFLAENPSAPPEMLSRMAATEATAVRCTVACNQNTPTPALLMLSSDRSEHVREYSRRCLALRDRAGNT